MMTLACISGKANELIAIIRVYARRRNWDGSTAGDGSDQEPISLLRWERFRLTTS